VKPTRAERADYPARLLLLCLSFAGLLTMWMIATLIYYAARDRR